MARFKQEVLEKIKSDPDLFAEVSKVLGVNPASLHMVIHRNGNKLNQFVVVKAVSDYLRVPAETLIEHTAKTAA
jgi:hypothetical protein